MDPAPYSSPENPAHDADSDDALRPVPDPEGGGDQLRAPSVVEPPASEEGPFNKNDLLAVGELGGVVIMLGGGFLLARDAMNRAPETIQRTLQLMKNMARSDTASTQT